MAKNINFTNGDNDSLYPQLVMTEYFNGNFPSTYTIENIEVKISWLNELIDNKSFKKYIRYNNFNGKFSADENLVKYCFDEILLVKDGYGLMISTMDLIEDTVLKKEKTEVKIIVYYDPNLTRSDSKTIGDIFKNDIFENINQVKYKSPIDPFSHINLVIEDNKGLSVQEFNIKNPKMNLKAQYGIEFVKIHKDILKSIKKTDKGIWIFHGIPGTGKTYYIRHLIKEINKMSEVNEVIYMSTDMIASIETPQFLNFIKGYEDSVLVIEDADLALMKREDGGNIVKTILQLTDGMLSDCLRLKIIATFNCPLTDIDEAVLRKGRLQLRHEFRVLTREEAINLAQWLKLDLSYFTNETNIDKKTFTLTEVYNIKQAFDWEKKVKKKIGFN